MFYKTCYTGALLSAYAAAIESTPIDMGMYSDSLMLAQTGVTYGGPEDPVCTLKVHSVEPEVHVPKYQVISESEARDLPDFMRKRMVRRYED